MTAIRVELELADGQFVSRMLHAGESVDRFKQNVARGSKSLQDLHNAGINVISSINRADQASKGFLATLRDVSIVTGMLSLGISKVMNLQSSWIGSIVKINAEFEKLNFQMRGMARSADPIKEAGQNVAWLREKAMEMPFSLESITNGFVRLNATGIDPTKGALDALADGLTAFGGGEEQMKRMLIGISQMSGKGVVQMEEMRQQIAEHMPRAMELMARSMGVSMAQLIKDIGTGRVESKSALEAFFAELNRTFGGRAAQMMDTFNGQLQRTKTQLELLATSDTIRLKFFDGALKDQLRDLNEFLTSPRAQAYANQLGDAMAKAVQWVRRGIDTLIEFRNEIGNVATAAAYIFGGHLLVKGFSAFTGALGTLRSELKIAGMQFAQASVQANLWTIAANSGAPATIRYGNALATLRSGMSALITVGAAFLPWITGLGLAVYAAGQYFGWFGDKVGDAYRDLEKFGAETRKQAEDISGAHIKNLQDRIGAIKAINPFSPSQGWKDELANLEKELAAALARRESLVEQSGEREDAQMLTRYNLRIERELNLIKGKYDREQIALNEKHTERLKKAQEHGESVQDLEEKLSADLAAGQKKYHEDNIAQLQQFIAWEESVLRYSDGDKNRQAQVRLDSLNARLRQELEMMRNFRRRSVELIATPDDPNKSYEKGEKLLQSLQEKLSGVRAEIAGTSPELAKLQEMLNNKKFGDMGREEVEALAKSIRGATAELAALEEIRKGQKDAERDLENIEKRLFEREMELLERQQGRTITEGERFVLRMQNGAYKGLGPASQIAKALEGVHGRLDIAGSKSNQLGDALRQNTFGDQTQNKIQGVNDKLRETALILDGIGQNLNGINFGSFDMAGGFAGMSGITPRLPTSVPTELAGRMKEAMEILIAKGWSKTAASGIVGNLSGESSLNPNARNKGDGRDGSDSIGVAQWNSGRARALQQFARQRGTQWNDFRTQIEFIDWELKNNANYGGSALQMASSPEAASDIFMRRFERPAAWAIRESGPKRAQYARNAYSMQGGAPTTQSEQASFSYNPDRENAMREQIAATEKALVTARELSNREKDLLTKEQSQARKDYLSDIISKTEEAKKGIEGTGKNLKQLQDLIRSGKLGSKDLNAPEYKDMIEAVKELDRVEQDRSKRKAAMSKADTSTEDLNRRQIEMARRVEEANARIFDPLEKKSTSAYRSLRQDLDQYIADVERGYGRDTQAYREAVAMKDSLLKQHRNMEVSENAAKWSKETLDTRRSLMSATQQRQLALQDEIARIDAEVAAFQGSEEEKVRIVAAAEARKAALRQQAAAAGSPVTGMLQQWADTQTNLANATQNWMNSLADGVTNLVMGTGDLRGVIQGILKDIVNMGVKWMMSQLWSGMGNKAGTPNMGQKGQGGKGKMMMAGKGKAGVMHTGGIVGAASVHRAVNPGIFSGAKKYHTGGIIGNPGPKLSRGEVPIIAQEGEGVFTPEQMSALGGFNQTTFQISAPISIQGSSGTPEQNQDLATRMAKQMEDTMRGVVADELKKQTRPGNFGNSRSR